MKLTPETCQFCGQVMKENSAYYGVYCSTDKCFNSWQARLKFGPRFNRIGAGK
jgi:hypothetical protein